MFLYLTNRFYNIHIIRCFGNSFESIATIVLLNYYADISHKFDKNVKVFTALMTASLMIRCTAPLGWVPLILYKIFVKKSMVAFIKSGIIIAIPSLVIMTIIDSMYYGKITFVPYTFMYKNLVENISASYGISPPLFYLTSAIPYAMKSAIPLFVLAMLF
jgi:hypothetical protein